MIVGIVGLPSCGKTTVFNAITGSSEATGSFSTAEVTHTATVRVHDDRLVVLRDIFNPKKFTPAAFLVRDFCIISGEGEKIRDINPRLLSDVREVDAVLKVVRGFDSPNGDPPDPLTELLQIDSEFLFADLEIIERRIEKLEKSTKKPHPNVEKEKKELEVLLKCREQLMNERLLSEMNLKSEEEKLLRGFQFLSLKPSLVLLNLPDDCDSNEARRRFHALFERYPDTVELQASIQMEIAQLPEEERAPFLEEMGIKVIASDKVIQACLKLLGLISFFTIGKDEVRAWTIPSGANAVTAAGQIHTDLAKGFIRAEVFTFEDGASVAYDIKKARANGITRLEGRDYIVRDGDIMEIRFNV